MPPDSGALLAGFRVAQLGPGLAAAVCGRLLADLGASVARIGCDETSPLARYLNHGPSANLALSEAALIVAEGRPSELHARGHDAARSRRENPAAALVFIAPFGQTGPQCEQPASDLTLAYASGIARLLTGQVDDLSEAPIRPVGQQSAFIGGLAAACAGMHAALLPERGAVIDVSIQEALATLAMTELARAGLSGKGWSRKRLADGNGATVCILPASDGFVAISPREDHQWAAWLEVMGAPGWGREKRFARKPDRAANWDALHALMSAWSRQHRKQWIAGAAQAARVPSFPLRELDEHFASPQLAHRGFWRELELDGRSVRVPGPPFGVMLEAPRSATSVSCPGLARAPTSLPRLPQQVVGARAKPGRDTEGDANGTVAPAHQPTGPLPLSGLRVLDFSWVIAGPTTTRTLAAMGAEVIKVEAPGRGDPGRASELHTVLGQAKRGIVLDLKRPEAAALARALAARCDVLVENFATGVMDRLGLGAEALRSDNPGLIYVSASGLGRTGPEAQAAAYGTLLQCYAGFAGLNRHPGMPPRVGFAWVDPMCGLMLAFAVAAALWRRQRDGAVARIDFSMVEALLWTMAEPLVTTQSGGRVQPAGNAGDQDAPHGAYRCAGADAWLSLAVGSDQQWQTLCSVVPALQPWAGHRREERLQARAQIDAALAAWLQDRDAAEADRALLAAGIPAAALAGSLDLVASPHLQARGFWDEAGAGVLPGLPWRGDIGRHAGPAPGLGADTDAVLTEVLGLSPAEIAELRAGGALG